MSITTNVEIKCPICGRVNWLDEHDAWECIGVMAEQLRLSLDALETSRDALRSASTIADGGLACANEDCPWQSSRAVVDVEAEISDAFKDVTAALEAMGVKV